MDTLTEMYLVLVSDIGGDFYPYLLTPSQHSGLPDRWADTDYLDSLNLVKDFSSLQDCLFYVQENSIRILGVEEGYYS